MAADGKVSLSRALKEALENSRMAALMRPSSLVSDMEGQNRVYCFKTI
jgi:hypothetical protein